MEERKNLRKEQPHLWQRIVSLAIAFFAIGFPLIFAPLPQTPNANRSIMGELLPLRYHAIIFMIIGMSLLIGCFYSRRNYIATRVSLSAALGYSVMWLLSLIYGGFTGNLSAFAIVSLWGFFTYIIYNTLQDPGFVISDLIREVRKYHEQ